jgi:hypothetical protein
LRLPISTLVFLTLLGYSALFSYAESRGRLSHQHQNLESAYEIDSVVPPAQTMALVFLGHQTFAATLAWIAALIDYGEALRNKVKPSVNAQYHADVIATLDPFFRRIYFWFDAVSMGTGVIVTSTDIDRANRMLDRGAKVFPVDRAFPNAAAMNFIGYSKDASTERRIDELTRGIAYLERSSLLPGADPFSPFVLSNFYNERRRLQGDKSSKIDKREVAFYKELYLTTSDAEVKRRLRELLATVGVKESDLVKPLEELQQRLRHQHLSNKPYIPLGLWLELMTD